MARTALSLALLAILAAGLAGCLGSAPPVPRDHYYRIAVPAPAPRGPVTFPGVISVAPLEADGLLRERPLLYSASEGAREVQQHDYHYWIDPPPRMLQAQLVDYLRAGDFADAVVTPELRVRPDFELSGRVRRLERLLGAGEVRVAAELELALVESAAGRLIVVQTYEAERVAADDSVAASVIALDAAVADIFARFLAEAGTRQGAARPAR